MSILERTKERREATGTEACSIGKVAELGEMAGDVVRMKDKRLLERS